MMELERLRAAVAIFIACTAFCAIPGNAAAHNEGFRPNETIQKELKEFYNVKDERERRQQLERIEELSDGRDDLVQQLVWFGSRARGTREAMVPGVVINALRISDDEIVTALTPYLGVEDEKFKRNIEQLIRDLEPGLKSPQRSYDYLYSVLEESARQGALPPRPLVRFIYRSNPGNALHNMQRAYLRGDAAAHAQLIVWAEHVVQDAVWKKEHGYKEAFGKAKQCAVHQLALLSRQEEWWIRLYVAEILRDHPELGTTGLIEKLAQDENELVRESVGAE